MAMSAGRVRHVRRSTQSLLSLAALMYALVLMASPLWHHDLACELKSRTHCTSCVSGVAGPGLESHAEPPAHQMAPADALPSSCTGRTVRSFIGVTQGRAPPAA